MLLDLGTIRTPHTSVEEVYAPQTFREGEEAYRVAEPVSLRFDVLKTDERYRLTGRVQTVLELPCSRCIEPFLLPVDAGFDLLYYPQPRNAGEGELEVEEEDLSVAFYENDEIDLSQLMREQFYLALPMKPLCAEECRGLCPICGINLNRAACDCRRDWSDPRLAVLKRIKNHGVN